MEKLLKFRLVGDNISPEKISSNDFAKLISAYEDAIVAFFEKKHPDKKDLGFISVVGIKNESAGVEFLPNYENEFIEVANIINTSINNNTISKLPFTTVENLHIIQNYVSKKGCIAELNGYDKIASTKITPSTNLRITKEFFVEGETTVYGKIVRIGGKRPIVRIQLESELEISIEITEKKAKELSPYLYETIGVKGFAKWKKENYELEDIKAKSFILMENKSLNKKIKELGGLLGKYWVDIDNPDDYVASLRS
jgi:hypothetical protein